MTNKQANTQTNKITNPIFGNIESIAEGNTKIILKALDDCEL